MVLERDHFPIIVFLSLFHVDVSAFILIISIIARKVNIMPNKVNGTQNGIMKNGGTNVTSPRGSMASTRVADATSIMTGKSSLSKMGLAMNDCCSDDPRSPRGRKQQLVKVLGMASIPIIVLMCLSAKILADAILQQQYAQSFKKEVQFAVQAGEVVHALGL